jgi:NitT/TauT family transport system substrate-binding protein
MKKLLAAIAVLVVVAVAGFYAFGNKKPSLATTQKPLKVSFHSWIGNGIYFIAQEKGFWKKEGVNVEMQEVDDNAVSKQLLSSNKVDGIMGWTPETIQILADSGVPMKVVFATDYSDGADGIVSTANIKTLADLKGKTVSFESGSPSHLFLSYLLDQAGIPVTDLKVINQPAADAGAAFVAGKVDAAVTWEPWLTKSKERKGGHVLVSSKDLPILPALPAFRTEVIKNRPQDVQAFMRGVFDAEEYVKSNPDEAYAIIAKGFNLSKQDVVDQIPTFHWLSYQDNINYFSDGSTSLASVLNKTGDLWVKLALIKKSTNASSILDDSLLKTLYK